MGKFPVCLIDISQGALICLVQRLRQIGQCMLDTCWNTAADVYHLTIHPAEPTSQKSAEIIFKFSIGNLHPVGFFREDVNDQFLVLRFPFSVFRVCINGRLNILLDVPLLFALIMQGNGAEN